MSPVSFRPAKRGRSYVMIGIAGYSGTGKTFSALRLARGLAGDKPFAFIDTEAGRAEHYDWLAQPWDHATLEPPFTSEAYLDAIRTAEKAGYPVIVVDSMSHQYSGPGGLQDQAEEELERLAGGDARLQAKLGMSSWNRPKRRHRQMVEQLTRVRAHLILCFRAREAIEMRKDPRTGKTEVVPVESIPGHSGWLIDTEHKNRPLPYEMTASLLLIPRPEGERGLPIPVKLENQHRSYIPLDKPLSEETGAALAKWAAGDSDAPTATNLKKETLDSLMIAKRESGVSDAWMREQLTNVGMANVPEKASLATIKRLTNEQGHQLLSALNAKVDEQMEATA